jgi:hypothetical protein
MATNFSGSLSPHHSNMFTRVAASNGTFTKSKFKQPLLVTASSDGNDNTIILAWGVFKSENEDSWRFFMEHVKM